MNLSGKTDAELKNIIANHEAKRLRNADSYLAAPREWETRHGAGFNFDRSMDLIRKAARERRCLSYKQLADHSNIPWAKARHAVGPHLDRLCHYAYGKGWPLLTAIVVNQENIATHTLNPQSLAGFIKTAEQLIDAPINDREAFLRDEQERVFAWAEIAA